MVGLAGALAINIGTLSPSWVDAMLRRRRRRQTSAGSRSSSTRSGPARRHYRTETARRILDEVDVTVLRGNAGEVATLVGVSAEVRGVESIAAGGFDPGELAREAARTLEVVASVTGPVDHVSDGEREVEVANGDAMLATVTGTGCMSTAITGRVPRLVPDDPLGPRLRR